MILTNSLLSQKNIDTEGEGWDLINRFNTAIFMCLFLARIWISKVKCCGVFCLYSVSSVKMRGDR